MRGKSVGAVTIFHYYHHSPLWNTLALDVFWNSEFLNFKYINSINFNKLIFLQQITLSGVQ